MAEIMTNFTAGDMPGAQKPVKKAAAPKKVQPAPTPTPEPVAVEEPETTTEPVETVEVKEEASTEE